MKDNNVTSILSKRFDKNKQEQLDTLVTLIKESAVSPKMTLGLKIVIDSYATALETFRDGASSWIKVIDVCHQFNSDDAYTTFKAEFRSTINTDNEGEPPLFFAVTASISDSLKKEILGGIFLEDSLCEGVEMVLGEDLISYMVNVFEGVGDIVNNFAYIEYSFMASLRDLGFQFYLMKDVEKELIVIVAVNDSSIVTMTIHQSVHRKDHEWLMSQIQSDNQ